MTGEQPERPAAIPQPSEQPSLSDSTVEGVRWMGMARVVADTAAFAGSLVLARFIAPAQFGYAAAALGLAAIATGFAQALTAPLVQFPVLRRPHFETAMLLSLVVGFGFVVLAPIVAVLAVEPLLGESVADLFLISVPMFAAAAVSAVPKALLQRALAFRRLAMIEVVAVLSGTAVSLLLATLAGLEGAAIVLGLVGMHVLTLALLLAYAPRTRPRWGGSATARSLFRFGGSVGLTSVLSTIAFNIDYLVLSARLSPAAVGYYWRGFALGVTYPSKISNIMLSISLPLYSRTPNPDEMRRLRLRIMATHAAAMFPVLVIIIVTAPVLVPWLFGPAWESSVIPTQLLAGAGMCVALTTGGPSFITALGKPQYVPPIVVVMIVGLGSTAYFSAPLGLNAVAACVLGWYVLFLFANHYFLLHRVGGIGLRDLFADAIPPLIACMPLAAAGLVTMHGLEAVGAAPLIVLTTTVVVGLAAYAAALRLVFPGTWKSLLRVAPRTLGRPEVRDALSDDAPALGDSRDVSARTAG